VFPEIKEILYVFWRLTAKFSKLILLINFPDKSELDNAPFVESQVIFAPDTLKETILFIKGSELSPLAE
jgi:hypothetical protein